MKSGWGSLHAAAGCSSFTIGSIKTVHMRAVPAVLWCSLSLQIFSRRHCVLCVLFPDDCHSNVYVLRMRNMTDNNSSDRVAVHLKTNKHALLEFCLKYSVYGSLFSELTE